MERRPEIAYPCVWTYTLIGEGEDLLDKHIETALAGRAYERQVGRKSSGGKYTSVEVTLVVLDEAERLAIFDRLKVSPVVRVIL